MKPKFKGILLILFIIFLIVVGCQKRIEENVFNSSDNINTNFSVDISDIKYILGYINAESCYYNQCNQTYDTPWGNLIGDYIKSGQEITFFTDNFTRDKDKYVFVFKAKMFGNGNLNWYINDKFLLRTEVISKSKKWRSDYENIEINYDYVDKDSGIFYIKLPRSMIPEGEKRIKIKIQLNDARYFAILQDKMTESIYRENEPIIDVYGYESVNYCEKYCKIVVDSFMGKVLADFSFENQSLSIKTPKIETNNSTYVRYELFGGWYGNPIVEVYSNEKKIITFIPGKENYTKTERGYKIDVIPMTLDDEMSGKIYIYMPAFEVNKKENSISFKVISKGWFSIYTITKKEAKYLTSEKREKFSGNVRILECSTEFCDIEYPFRDVLVRQSWIYDNQSLTFETEDISGTDAEIIDFSILNIQYGHGTLTWKLNSQPIFITQLGKKDSTYVNEPFRLTYEFFEYDKGNIGRYTLTAPRELLKSNNNITVELKGKGWFMLRN